MSNSGQEIEAKFYVLHLNKMTTRMHDLKARLIQPRVLETNFRFDLPDSKFRSTGRVLRLRRDTKARLTYKGASQNKDGVLDRQEIEFIVEDFEKARQFLEALGYQKSIYYEKYRATYELEHVLIMLDELPFGNFVEVEGETVEQIQAVSARLNLNWNAAIGTSYTALFENVRKVLKLSFQDISFENFDGINVRSDHLDVTVADG
jgi:adenylate cyclase class 2